MGDRNHHNRHEKQIVGVPTPSQLVTMKGTIMQNPPCEQNWLCRLTEKVACSKTRSELKELLLTTSIEVCGWDEGVHRVYSIRTEKDGLVVPVAGR